MTDLTARLAQLQEHAERATPRPGHVVDAQFISAASPHVVSALAEVAQADDLLVRWLDINVQGALADIRAEIQGMNNPRLQERFGGLADNIEYMISKNKSALARLDAAMGGNDE